MFLQEPYAAPSARREHTRQEQVDGCQRSIVYRVCMRVHACACISVCVVRVSLGQNTARRFHYQLTRCVCLLVFLCVLVCDCDYSLHEKRKSFTTNKKDTNRSGNKDPRNKHGFQDTPALIRFVMFCAHQHSNGGVSLVYLFVVDRYYRFACDDDCVHLQSHLPRQGPKIKYSLHSHDIRSV